MTGEFSDSIARSLLEALCMDRGIEFQIPEDVKRELTEEEYEMLVKAVENEIHE